MSLPSEEIEVVKCGFGPHDYEVAKQFFSGCDPKIYHLLVKHGYLPPLPKRNLYANLIGVIIGQRIRFATARKLRRSLYLSVGTDNFTYVDILNLGLIGLKQLGIGQVPAETIMTVTANLVINRRELKTIDDIRKLKSIKGIGDWTINCVILTYTMSHGEIDDIILLEDLIIRRGLRDMYPTMQISSTTEINIIRQLSRQWSPWRGVVTWYIWKEYS